MDETTPHELINQRRYLIFSGRQLIISSQYPTSAEHYFSQDYESFISTSPYLIFTCRHVTSAGYYSLTLGYKSLFSSACNLIRQSFLISEVIFTISAGSYSLTMDPEHSISSGCSLITPGHITSESIFISAGPFFIRPCYLTSEGLFVIISAGLFPISENSLFIRTVSVSLISACPFLITADLLPSGRTWTTSSHCSSRDEATTTLQLRQRSPRRDVESTKADARPASNSAQTRISQAVQVHRGGLPQHVPRSSEASSHQAINSPKPRISQSLQAQRGSLPELVSHQHSSPTGQGQG